MNKFRKLLASIAALGMLLTSVPAVATAGFSDVSDDNVFAPFIDHGVDVGYFSGANANFYPNNNLTRGELAKIAVVGAGLTEDTTKGPHFDDVAEDNVFYSYVETLLNNGAISAHKTFRPDDKVTRAEAAKILVMAFGFEINTDGGPTFPDVAADNAFYVYVETAANNNLVNGYSDGNFGPYNNITRGEAAKILAMATGYTGTWGEAAGVVLTLSADTVDVGGSLNMTAKVVDADGNTVQDYDGVAEFTVSTGNVSDKSVDLVRGQAKVTYTAPGYGAEGTVSVKVGDYADEAEFSVVIPADQKMMLYAADYKVNGTDTTTLYLTLSDDKGNPVNGKASDLTFDVTGDATVGTVAAFPGGADGVYRATLTTAAASVGVNTITVTDNNSGESTKVDVEVGQPMMEVYLVDPVVSVNQATTLLVYLTQGDGSPITVAAANLSASFLNAELGATSAETEIAAGWYSYTVTADNRVSEDAKLKVSYTGVTPNVHEYVSLKVAPYNVSVEVTPDDINNLTGVATLIVSLTDVNGKPVDLDTNNDGTLDYSIDSKLDVDVITSAVWQDPSGNQDFAAADWSWYNDVAGYRGNDGVLVTQLYACGVKDGTVPVSTCIVDDSSVEIKVREKSAVNKVIEAEATISFSDPIIDKVQNFNVTGGADVLVASVIDAKGAGITDLASQAAAGDTNGALLDTYFLADGATLDEIDVVHVGGGVYLLGSNGDTDVDKLTVGNDDADYQTLSDATTTNGNYVVVGDNSIAEGYTAAGTVRGGAVVTVVAANVPVSVAAVTLTSDDTGTVNSPTLVKVTNGTASRALDVEGDGDVDAADDALVTGMNFTDPSAVANAISAYPVDNIETATLTTSVAGTNVNTTTVSVHPIRVKFVSLDANGKTTDDAYGYLKTVNNDGRLEEVGVANVSNPDANGAANAAEIAFNNYDNGATDVAGVYTVKYERADGNNDSNEKAEIEFNLNGDDESMSISTWKFDLVNPTYDVYVQNDSTYVTPNTDAANGSTVEAQNAVFVLAVSRNDEGVSQDVSNATEVVLELAAGDGDVDDAADLTRDTAETQNLSEPAADANPGVYYGYYFPSDSARISNLEIYTGFDDDNDKYAFDIEVVYPTAQVVVYPTKIDPDKQNNEATVIAIIKDQFGNAVPNLSVTGTNPDLSVEIEGDQKLTSSDATADTMYYGNYSTDKTGTQTVEVKYNDDETLQTSEIQVEMID